LAAALRPAAVRGKPPRSAAERHGRELVVGVRGKGEWAVERDNTETLSGERRVLFMGVFFRIGSVISRLRWQVVPQIRATIMDGLEGGKIFKVNNEVERVENFWGRKGPFIDPPHEI
jgi:hypothetical protein